MCEQKINVVVRIKGNMVGAKFDDGFELFNSIKIVHSDEWSCCSPFEN